MKSKLKLFVWTEFSPDYTSGLAFAIAKDEPEARKLVEAFRRFFAKYLVPPSRSASKCSTLTVTRPFSFRKC